mgnify:CR=1 FL=1
MKHYYNIDSFEHFLRENTKDFKMMPKRRLCYSIYNNLHPSKKCHQIIADNIIQSIENDNL